MTLITGLFEIITVTRNTQQEQCQQMSYMSSKCLWILILIIMELTLHGLIEYFIYTFTEKGKCGWFDSEHNRLEDAIVVATYVWSQVWSNFVPLIMTLLCWEYNIIYNIFLLYCPLNLWLELHLIIHIPPC